MKSFLIISFFCFLSVAAIAIPKAPANLNDTTISITDDDVINNIVAGRVLKLLLAYDLLKAGASDAELASQTGTHPYFVRDLKSEAKNYKRDDKI